MKFRILFLVGILIVLFSASVFALSCGNGNIEGVEECDDGTDNSDTVADACRTDCVLPSCGDGVIDSGEECDEGPGNSDLIPGRCRTDCREPYCGDGVADVSEGEICDDGNNIETDGCPNNCYDCITPYEGLEISQSAKLCPGTYTINDENPEGVIIISGSGTIIDCQGAKIKGNRRQGDISTNVQLQGGQQNMQANLGSGNQQQNQQQSQEQNQGGFMAQFVGFFIDIFTGDEEEDDENSPAVQGPNNDDATNPWIGTGFNVIGDNVVLVNCEATQYKYGVRLNNQNNVLVSGKYCGNSWSDVKAPEKSNHDAGTMCDKANEWSYTGLEGCIYDCNGDLNTNVVPTECPETTECPECVCEECPVCEEEEEQPEPIVEEEETETEEEIEEEEEDNENELEICIKKYVSEGYSEEKAKAICSGEEIDDEEQTEEEEKKEEETIETNEDEECIKKYVSEGYSEEKAKAICSGEETEKEEETKPTTTTKINTLIPTTTLKTTK